MIRVVRGIDWIFVGAILAIVAMSIITLAGFYSSEVRLVTDTLIAKHVFSIVLGVCIAFSLSFLDYRLLQNSSRSLFIGIVGLLLALFVTGQTLKGAQSWFTLFGFGIQPVELAKVVTILLVAKYMATYHRRLSSFWSILFSGIPVMVIVLLTLAQPDFGSASMVFMTWLLMIFLAGIRVVHGFYLLLMGVGGFGFLWLFVFREYQKLRIMTFLNPTADPLGAGYNSIQSMRTVTNGGWFGQGVGAGARYSVPEVHSDFIFAGFSQGWGFVGVTVYFVLLVVILWRLFSLAMEVRDVFGRMIILGVASVFLVQTVVNIGMNLGVLPITGVPLPFMSYGGSSMMGFFLMVGLILSIQKHRQAKGTVYMRNDQDIFG